MSAKQPIGEGAVQAVLTFLIADIRGYTAYTRANGDEAAARLAATFAELAREGVEARGGTVIELRGDEALATFASPRQALRAATELQATFADEVARNADLPLRVGMGLDLGEAIPVEAGYRGAALNIAARLCASAAAGEILASESVAQLARGLEGVHFEPREPLVLKGIDEPVRAAAVTGTAMAATVVAERVSPSELPMALDPVVALVGRDLEARRLRWAWRQARRGSGRGVVVAGPFGAGKTRLAAEPAAIAASDGGRVVYASALAVAGGLSAAAARALEAGPPALLVVDDIESASAADLGSLAAVADGMDGRAMLVVALVNGEPSEDVVRVLRRFSGAAEWLRLAPLDQAAMAAIVATYAGDSADPPPVWAIAEASGGLPAQVHALASGWAQGEVARRLGSAVSRAAEGRRDLRRFEAEVASNVVDLQLARERLRLSGQAGTDDLEACPFKGLVAFDVGDADVFFGRERLVAEMVGRMAGSSFLGVVGPSGSGKSSAIRAGLVPALAAGALPGAEGWTRIIVRPGAHPVRELDRLLFAAVPEGARTALSKADDALAAAAAALAPEARPFVVVDQFEELFTTTTDEAERARFIDALVNAAQNGAATVIVAVRADFYGRCAAYAGLAELLGANHVLVGPMSAEEFRRAIEGPARRGGLQIDAALVDALVVEVIDEPGGLPLLSTALVELWEHREGRAIRLSAYAATGGVRGAVGRLAEAAYGRLDEAARLVARGLFLRLAAGEGDAVVRRRVPIAELDATANETVAEVVRQLTEARLLTVGEGTVEVAHEALLREWPRLQGWLDEDRAGRRLREHLIDSAREWDARGRDVGELYRGARLATAIDWTTDHSLELNETEKAFLAESRQASVLEVERQRRTNRRLRAFLAVAGVALVIAVGAGGLAALRGAEAEKARTQAEAAQAQSEQAQAQAERAAVAADAQRLGAQALTEKDLDRSLLLARQGVALDDDPATRANLLSALDRSPAAIGAWRPLPGRPQDIQVSPDGRTLLIRNNLGNYDLVDSSSGKVLRDLGDFGVFTSEGKVAVLVFSGSIQGLLTINVSTVGNDAVERTITFPPVVTNFSFAPDLSTISVVDADRHGVSILDPDTLAVVRHVVAPPGMTVIDVWQYADGNIMTVDHAGPLADENALRAAYDQPMLLHWWPSGHATPTAEIPTIRDGGWALSGSMTTIAVEEEGDNEVIFDLPNGRRRDIVLRHNGLQGATFTPDGKTLVTAGDDHLLLVWDVATGQLRETLAGHNGRVFAPAIAVLDGGVIAWSVSLDGQLIAWDLSGARRLGRPFSAGRTAELNGDGAAGVAVSPDGSMLASTDSDGWVDIVDTSSLEILRRIEAVPRGQAMSVAFSPDGRVLVVGGQGPPIVSRWDVASGLAIGAPLTGPPATLPRDPEDPNAPAGAFTDASRTVAFSPDGRWIAAGAEDGGVYLWDAATGAPAAGPAIVVGGPVFSLAFSPDSGSIAASYTLLTYDANSGQGTFGGTKTGIWSVADHSLLQLLSLGDDLSRPFATVWSPDGTLLATAGGDGLIRFWDPATGSSKGPSVLANAGWVETLAFDPSGATMISGGTDGTTRILDVVGRQQLGTALPGGDFDVHSALSPDGSHVYAVYGDGHAYAWNINPAAINAQACATAGRTLTQEEWDRYLPGRPYQPACAPGS